MSKLQNQLSRKSFVKSFNLFTKKQRTKLVILGVVQILLGLIDLVAVGILAILGKLAVTGVQSRQTTGNTYEFLKFLRIENFSVQGQAIILGTLALCLLITKSFASIILIQRSLKAIATASSDISANLISKVFSGNHIKMIGLEPHHVLYSLSQGVTLVTIGIIGTFTTIIGDIGLVILMLGGIVIINPTIAVISILIFGFTIFILSKFLHRRAILLGSRTANLNVQSNRQILELVQLHNEIYIRNKINTFTDEISKVRTQLMDTNRQLIFMPNISKYVLETTVLFGAFTLAGFEFFTNDAPTAVASLTLFLASGSRVVPALVRAQQGMMNIKTNLAASEETLNLVTMFSNHDSPEQISYASDPSHFGFIPEVRISNGFYTYPSNSKFKLKNINLNISAGEFVALVGKSGAGKSTLIDLLLGTTKFDSGEVLISGMSVEHVVQKWTGAIGYVPQNVKLIESTLRDNILLGYESSEIPDEKILELLYLLGLNELISREDGLDSHISHFSGGLSGGQVQRIGLARALVTNPQLLILDEATSSLDAETENIVSQILKKLHGEVTIIVVAHRLSTVKSADCLFWMEDGEIVSSGNFETLRRENANFETNVNLLGL